MGDKRRLFVALSVPPTWLPELRRVRPSGGEADARLHLTLQFLGRRDFDGTADALEDVRFTAFELSLAGLGTFGVRPPFVLWAGVQESKELRELHRRIADLFPGDQRPYRPHITLGRGDENGFREQEPPTGTTTVDRFHLWSSSDDGYVIERTYRAG